VKPESARVHLSKRLADVLVALARVEPERALARLTREERERVPRQGI
jgi:hypothetical protein